MQVANLVSKLKYEGRWAVWWVQVLKANTVQHVLPKKQKMKKQKEFLVQIYVK